MRNRAPHFLVLFLFLGLVLDMTLSKPVQAQANRSSFGEVKTSVPMFHDDRKKLELTRISMSHQDDFTQLGGNDIGHTFGNEINWTSYFGNYRNEHTDYEVNFKNDFYTSDATITGEQNTVQALETYKLSFSMKSWEDDAAKLTSRWYTKPSISLEYAESKPNPTGEQADYERFGIDLSIVRGAEVDLSPNLSVKPKVGFGSNTIALSRGHLDGEFGVSLHTTGESWQEKRDRTLEFECGIRAQQFWDGERSTDAYLRALTHLGKNGGISLQLECVQPLEVNGNLTKGLGDVDRDRELKVMFGLAF